MIWELMDNKVAAGPLSVDGILDMDGYRRAWIKGVLGVQNKGRTYKSR